MSGQHSPLYLDNTHLLELVRLRTSSGGAITSGVVEVTDIVDRRGQPVAGVSPPIPMTHVGDANWQCVIPVIGALRAGQTYEIKVRTVQSGWTGTWVERCTAQVRYA